MRTLPIRSLRRSAGFIVFTGLILGASGCFQTAGAALDATMTPQGGSVVNTIPTIATTEAPPPTAIGLEANLSPTTAQLVFATATLPPSPIGVQPTVAPLSFASATDIGPTVSETPSVTNTQIVIIVTATPPPITDTPVIIIITATPSITLTPSITNTPTATPTEPHIITPARTQPVAVAQAATNPSIFNADSATQTQQAVFGSATAILDTATAGANQQLTLIATLQGTGIPAGGVAPTAAPNQPQVVQPGGQGLMITFTPTPLPSINNAPVSGAMGPISNDCIYVVQAGDRLFRIAMRFNLTPYQVAYANNLMNQDYLSPEQKLRIPGCAIPTAVANVQSLPPTATTSPIVSPVPVGGPAAGSSNGKTYTVVDGDTLYGIATRFGVRVVALAQVNNIANISLIYIGQVLFIP